MATYKNPNAGEIPLLPISFESALNLGFLNKLRCYMLARFLLIMVLFYNI